MKIQLTMLKIFNLLSSCMTILGIHPPKDDENTSCVTYLLWWFYLSNYIVILTSTMYTRYITTSDVITLTYSWMEILLLLDSIITMFQCKFQKNHIKDLLSITRNQFKNETTMIRLDTTNMNVMIAIIMFFLYIAIVYIYVDKPESNIKGKLIMTAVYPFPMTSSLLKVFCYCNQIFTLMHFSVILVVEWMCVLIMYACALRLSILRNNWSNSKDKVRFKECLQEHKDILKCMKNINQMVRVVVMKTVFSFVFLSIFSGLQLVHYEHLTKEFAIPVFILMMAYLRILLCAENAEILTTINDQIQLFMYFSPWYAEERKFAIDKMIVIEQCRNTPKIHIDGFMSALDRKYLLKILYSTFSYFMTVRAIFSK